MGSAAALRARRLRARARRTLVTTAARMYIGPVPMAQLSVPIGRHPVASGRCSKKYLSASLDSSLQNSFLRSFYPSHLRVQSLQRGGL
jgi:hypothetical protein